MSPERYAVHYATQSTGAPAATLPELVASVCEGHGISESELVGRRRIRHLVSARRDFVVLARSHGYSYPAIGRALRRDHTSCIHLARTA